VGYGLPSKQLVGVVGGCRQARNVEVGVKLWSLDGTRTVQTTVVEVTAVKVREVVEVLTDRVTFTVGTEQELRTAEGKATGLPARLEPVTRPSGYLKRDVPGFRVRVVSSYLADAIRQYVGGDAHHMRQRFPRVVLRDEVTFGGFLDGYVDGDGHRIKKHWDARVVVSGNVPFLRELAATIGARFTPNPVPGRASRVYISDRWVRRGTLATASTRTPGFWSTGTSPAGPSRRQAVDVAPLLCSSSSGSLQMCSRKMAAAMTAMPARTEKPA
jgi:hypothetical protein